MDPAPSPTNVQVAVRCRPINEDEEKRGFLPIVSCDSQARSVKISYGASVDQIMKEGGPND